MNRPLRPRRYLGPVLAALGLLAAALPPTREAAAQDQPVPVSPCTLSGFSIPPPDLEVYSARTGGSPVAKLTGGGTPLVLSELPLEAGVRARVRTSTGKKGFRIDGFVDPAKIPLYTKVLVTSIPGHVWIAPAREVSLQRATAEKLQVRLELKAPFRQSFSGWAACSDLALEPGVPPGWEVPGKARGYVIKSESLDLLDDASRDAGVAVTLYKAAPDLDVLTWSERQKGAFVHVQYHGDVIFEGWAKANQLKALPRGETMDSQAPARRTRQRPKLAQEPPRTVVAPRDLTVRAQASETAPTLGVAEEGVELYVFDVVAGWAAVLPKELNVVPVGDHFWISAKDLGLAPP